MNSDQQMLRAAVEGSGSYVPLRLGVGIPLLRYVGQANDQDSSEHSHQNL